MWLRYNPLLGFFLLSSFVGVQRELEAPKGDLRVVLPW